MTNPALQPMTVAIVDDDVSFREALNGLIQSYGFETVLFDGGVEFLETADLTGIDCVVMDVHMPGLSGLDDVRADSAAHAILEILPAHPVVTAETAARFVGVSATAARTALDLLHERGILEPYAVPAVGTGRPRRWWLAQRLADLVRA